MWREPKALNANRVSRDYPLKVIRDFGDGFDPAANVSLYLRGGKVFPALMAAWAVIPLVPMALLNPADPAFPANQAGAFAEADSPADECPAAAADNRVARDRAAGDKIPVVADNTADDRDRVHPRRLSRCGQSKRHRNTNHTDKT